MKPADADRVSVVDEAIQEMQSLGDMYVRFLEIDSAEVTKPADVALLDDLLKAFARAYLAYRVALATVASTVTGNDDETFDGYDF